MPAGSAGTADHADGGVGLCYAMEPEDGMGSPDHKNSHKKQCRKPMVPSAQGSPRAVFCCRTERELGAIQSTPSRCRALPQLLRALRSPMTNPSHVSADFMLCQTAQAWWLHSHRVGNPPGCADITQCGSIPAPLHQQLPVF